MSKTLFVTDLDGTLLRSDKTISEETITLINKMIRQGVLITYATARSIISSQELTSEILFQIPVITRNGTVLADHFSKDEIEIESFDSTQIEKIRTVLKRMNLSGFVTAYTTGKGHTYQGHKWYLKSRSNPGFLSYLEEHKDDKRLQGVLTEKELFQGSISYFTFIGDKDELDPAYDYVKKLEDINYNYEQNKYSSEYWLEIFPKNATKAKAIEKLKRRFACDRVVVFGDSFNDEPMFQIADEAYAVANAEERIKELATGIIDSNDNDGIAKFLKGWIEKN